MDRMGTVWGEVKATHEKLYSSGVTVGLTVLPRITRTKIRKHLTTIHAPVLKSWTDAAERERVVQWEERKERWKVDRLLMDCQWVPELQILVKESFLFITVPLEQSTSIMAEGQAWKLPGVNLSVTPYLLFVRCTLKHLSEYHWVSDLWSKIPDGHSEKAHFTWAQQPMLPALLQSSLANANPEETFCIALLHLLLSSTISLPTMARFTFTTD